MKLTKKINMLAAASLMLCATTGFAQLYHVDVNTSTLGASASAPFSVDFQFNDGVILGNNSATVSNFSYGGGSASGSPILSSGVAGGLGTSITFNNSVSFAEIYQGITPGTSFGFNVALTNNSDGVAPDSFSFAILDSGLANITTSGFGGSLMQVSLTGSTLAPLTFNGTGDFTGVTVTLAPIPEPETYAMLIAGLGLLGFAARRKHQSA